MNRVIKRRGEEEEVCIGLIGSNRKGFLDLLWVGKLSIRMRSSNVVQTCVDLNVSRSRAHGGRVFDVCTCTLNTLMIHGIPLKVLKDWITQKRRRQGEKSLGLMGISVLALIKGDYIDSISLEQMPWQYL